MVNVSIIPSVVYNLSKKANRIDNHLDNFPILYASNDVFNGSNVNSNLDVGIIVTVNSEVHIFVYVVVNPLLPNVIVITS